MAAKQDNVANFSIHARNWAVQSTGDDGCVLGNDDAPRVRIGVVVMAVVWVAATIVVVIIAAYRFA